MFDESLKIKLMSDKPIEVADFLATVNGVQAQYKKILKEHGLTYSGDLKLYLQVKEGSVEWVFFILEAAASAIAVEILKYLYKRVTDILEKARSEKNIDSDLAVLKDLLKILKSSVKSQGGQIIITYENKKTGESLTFDIKEGYAVEIYQIINEIIKFRKVPEPKPDINRSITSENFEKEKMQLVLTGDNTIKAKIDRFSPEAMPIICDEVIRRSLIERSAQNPFFSDFLVTGVVLIRGGKISAYRLLQLNGVVND